MGVRMRHPDLDAEIVVPDSAVPFHAGAGWTRVDQQQPPVDDGLDTMTVAQLQVELRSRDLPISGNKAELVARLRGEPAEPEPEVEAEQEEPGEAAEQNPEEGE